MTRQNKVFHARMYRESIATEDDRFLRAIERGDRTTFMHAARSIDITRGVAQAVLDLKPTEALGPDEPPDLANHLADLILRSPCPRALMVYLSAPGMLAQVLALAEPELRKFVCLFEATIAKERVPMRN